MKTMTYMIALCFSSLLFSNDDKFALSLGIGSIENADGRTSYFQSSDNAESYELNLNYSIHKYASLGIGYINFGNSMSNSTGSSGRGLSVSGRLSTRSYFGVSTFFQTGYLSWKRSIRAQYSFGGNQYTRQQRGSGLDPFFGVGISFEIEEDLNLLLTTDQYYMNLDATFFEFPNGFSYEPSRKKKMNNYSLKIAYSF